MRSTLILLIIATIALLHGQVSAQETCRPGNCMSAEQCEILVNGRLSCSNEGEICCSVVKTEYRTLCQHWGGECMDRCSESLMRNTIDCGPNEQCCVLV